MKKKMLMLDYASGSCNQSERALQKAHVLLEKCQQNKNAKNRQSGTILIV
jgi:hypothetical protein